MNNDRIEIKDLLLRCIIGVNAEERQARQDVLINLVLWMDTQAAAEGDDIATAVNYRTVAKEVIAQVEASQYYLVETLAERIAETCLKDPRVRKVRVSVEKPGALRFARSVGVRIERKQRDRTRKLCEARKSKTPSIASGNARGRKE
jgi:D-erythro-7,8-dihydroneopterin triphosphate epimerase